MDIGISNNECIIDLKWIYPLFHVRDISFIWANNRRPRMSTSMNVGVETGMDEVQGSMPGD